MPSSPLSSNGSTSPPPVTAGDTLPACGRVNVTSDRPAFAWGERVNITLRIANCGPGNLTLSAGAGCEPSALPRLSGPAGGTSWVFLPGDDTPWREGNAPACRAYASIPPGGSHEESWSWDGLVRAPLVTCALASLEACSPKVLLDAGNVSFVASFDVANQAFLTLPWGGAPVCGNLTLAPASLATSGNATRTFHATVRSCMPAPLGIADSPGCFETLGLDVSRGNGTWTWQTPDAPPLRETFAFSHGHCIGSFGTIGAVLVPGGTFERDYVWSGTLVDEGLCPSGDGGMTNCRNATAAQPGTYLVSASFATGQGATWTANATLDVGSAVR